MLILYGFVMVAVMMDIKSGKISNRLIFWGLCVALVRRLWVEGSVGLLTGVVQISLPVIILYLFFLAGALGAGDIKLFSLIGGFVNLKELMTCIIAAFVLGAVWALIQMILKGVLFAGIKSGGRYFIDIMLGKGPDYKKTAENVMPFSIVILGGLMIATLC